MTPQPNRPLTAEDVGLLKRGDVLRVVTPEVADYFGPLVRFERAAKGIVRAEGIDYHHAHFTFVGRPDSEGWMPWMGGNNPVPGALVDVRRRDGGVCAPYKGQGHYWHHDGDPADIIAFRIPSPVKTNALLTAAERAYGEGEVDAMLAARPALSAAPVGDWAYEICTGCSASMSDAEIKAGGYVSCCPDRRMVTVRDLVRAYETQRKQPVCEEAPAEAGGWPEELTPEMEQVWRSAFISQGHLRRNHEGHLRRNHAERLRYPDSCEKAAYRALHKFVSKSLRARSSEPVAWRYRCINPQGLWLLTDHAPTNAAIVDRPNVWEVQPLYTHPAAGPDKLRVAREALSGLVVACLASDFNECWDEYQAAVSALASTGGQDE